MRKAGFYFCGAILSVSALVLGAGCGPDSSSGATGGGGGGTNPASTSGSGESSASTNPASTSTSGGGTAATCDSYCADITTNCTGDLIQYTNADACKAACKGITTIGMPGDTSGASLECHAYHAKAAATDQKVHCPHAGPTGGDKVVSDMTPGACGDGCANFCEIALVACKGQTGAYADLAACTADCSKFKDTTQDAYNSKYYTDMANWKNDFGCRMYHLSVAATSTDAAKAHCPHIVAASPVCTK